MTGFADRIRQGSPDPNTPNDDSPDNGHIDGVTHLEFDGVPPTDDGGCSSRRRTSRDEAQPGVLADELARATHEGTRRPRRLTSWM